MSDDGGWLVMILGIARAILHDRVARRRILAQSLAVVLALVSLGLWAVDDWLKVSLLRFFLWWAGCAVTTLWLLAFAVYDALAVVREEREKVSERKTRADSPCDD